ncbi:hypothetical protein NQ038_11750 [Brevibacterium sp. 50QC2O2]|uniref:hypothetical protein n=1 Tax=Brevibacterium TaxID=1696 RepID=UPI00211BC04C|nr:MULTISPECIES: hypothetical protein [unclassified Brevibacterium]MCQ9386563.1 hypothetical protein [Brevibacterium sp. 68QC2CO]MCQ9389313.1 hypothetical protein [Brevibacterium sp. 50QC2O2]
MSNSVALRRLMITLSIAGPLLIALSYYVLIYLDFWSIRARSAAVGCVGHETDMITFGSGVSIEEFPPHVSCGYGPVAGPTTVSVDYWFTSAPIAFFLGVISTLAALVYWVWLLVSRVKHVVPTQTRP